MGHQTLKERLGGYELKQDLPVADFRSIRTLTQVNYIGDAIIELEESTGLPLVELLRRALKLDEHA